MILRCEEQGIVEKKEERKLLNQPQINRNCRFPDLQNCVICESLRNLRSKKTLSDPVHGGCIDLYTGLNFLQSFHFFFVCFFQTNGYTTSGSQFLF